MGNGRKKKNQPFDIRTAKDYLGRPLVVDCPACQRLTDRCPICSGTGNIPAIVAEGLDREQLGLSAQERFDKYFESKAPDNPAIESIRDATGEILAEGRNLEPLENKDAYYEDLLARTNSVLEQIDDPGNGLSDAERKALKAELANASGLAMGRLSEEQLYSLASEKGINHALLLGRKPLTTALNPAFKPFDAEGKLATDANRNKIQALADQRYRELLSGGEVNGVDLETYQGRVAVMEGMGYKPLPEGVKLAPKVVQGVPKAELDRMTLGMVRDARRASDPKNGGQALESALAKYEDVVGAMPSKYANERPKAQFNAHRDRSVMLMEKVIGQMDYATAHPPLAKASGLDAESASLLTPTELLQSINPRSSVNVAQIVESRKAGRNAVKADVSSGRIAVADSGKGYTVSLPEGKASSPDQARAAGASIAAIGRVSRMEATGSASDGVSSIPVQAPAHSHGRPVAVAPGTQESIRGWAKQQDVPTLRIAAVEAGLSEDVASGADRSRLTGWLAGQAGAGEPTSSPRSAVKYYEEMLAAKLVKGSRSSTDSKRKKAGKAAKVAGVAASSRA